MRCAMLRWSAACLLLIAGSGAQAANLYLIWGDASVSGRSEAADWDTDHNGKHTGIVWNGGGWNEDTACGVAACLDIATGVNTAGGAASTRVVANVLPLGGGEYLFQGLAVRLAASGSADVSDIGIVSDAEGKAQGSLLLAADQTTEVLVEGTCTAGRQGEEIASSCLVLVFGPDGNRLVAAGQSCSGAQSCEAPISQRFTMEAGQLYFLTAAASIDVSTSSSGSAEADIRFTVSQPQ